jgi:hypothetical protein
VSDARPAALLAEAVRRLTAAEAPRGTNRSVLIDYWNHEAGAPLASPWCLSFVRQASIEAVGRSRTPWPRTASVQALVEWALRRHVAVDITEANPGDLVVWYYPSLARFGHVAVLEQRTATHTTTIDGNSNDEGSREGFRVVRKTRLITPRVRAIRWPAEGPAA